MLWCIRKIADVQRIIQKSLLTSSERVRSLPVFLAVSNSLGISYLFISFFLTAVLSHTPEFTKFQEKILLQEELVQVGCVKEN